MMLPVPDDLNDCKKVTTITLRSVGSIMARGIIIAHIILLYGRLNISLSTGKAACFCSVNRYMQLLAALIPDLKFHLLHMRIFLPRVKHS